MSVPEPSGSASDRGVAVPVGGGVATGCISALVAALGVLPVVLSCGCQACFHARDVDLRLAAMELPARPADEGSLAGKISTALINLAVGIAIGTLLTAVLSRTVTDAERSWQRR